MTRTRLLVIVGAAAVAIAAVLIGISLVGGGDDGGGGGGGGGGSALRGVSESQALLAGVPQQGIALGRPDAPVTLAEYADLQCPFCREWTLRTLPTLVADYVRKGDLRIEFRGLAFIGPDSLTALESAEAAGEQTCSGTSSTSSTGTRAARTPAGSPTRSSRTSRPVFRASTASRCSRTATARP